MSDDEHPTLEEALANRKEVEDSLKDNVIPIREAPPVPSDELGRNTHFIDKVLSTINPDLFDTSVVVDAKAYLQTPNVKNNLAFTNVGFDGAKLADFDTQIRYGELRNKRDEVYSIAKRTLDDGYKGWLDEIKQLERKARNGRYSDGQAYTAFTTPRGKYLVIDKDGDPVPCVTNAITALRDHLAARHSIITYDHWRNAISLQKQQSRYPRESKDFVVKNLINEIYERTKVLYTIEHVKFAMGQLAVFHQYHSLLDYFAKQKWDKKSRIKLLVTDIMKLEGTSYQIAVITMQLIASVRRVRFPGAKYDMCPLLIAEEGLNKSSFIVVLYGRRNVLAEDILDLSTKEQSEKLRNGIWAVEFADTLGDDKRTNARKIKAFISRQDDVGRDAYGHVEDVEHIGRTCVYWHTGNNPHLLTSEEGNRRFAPMQVLGMMDLDLLRKERDQIWAEAVELERIGREKYEAEMRTKGVPVNPGDEIYPDIMLEQKYWDEGKKLTNQAMVPTGYENFLSNVLYWSEVIWQDAKYNHYYCISILSTDIKARLQIPDYRWNGESQKISKYMKNKVEIRKSECEGLTADICWIKTDTLKKAGSNIPLNGYRIELTGDIGKAAFEILKKKKEDWDKQLGLM